MVSVGALVRPWQRWPVNRTRLACLVVAVAFLAVALGHAGAVFMNGFEEARPALARAAPRLAVPGPRLARHVVLVIIDGLGLVHSHELPFLDHLRQLGAATSASSHYPSWSRPNYVSILTGVPPSASGIRTNYHPTSIVLDTIMDRARAGGLRVGVVSDRAMLPPLFLRSLADPGRPIETARIVRGDRLEAPPGFAWPIDDARFTHDDFGRVLRELTADDLVIALTGVVDAEGHAHGGASPEYRAAAVGADRVLAEALGGVDLARDAILITADHGHSDVGGHGGLEPEVLTVPLIAAGAGIVPGSVARDAHLIDIAPTIAALLGIAAPGHGLGRALTELLAPTEVHGELARVEANVAIEAAAIDDDADAVAWHRALRFALVALAAWLVLRSINDRLVAPLRGTARSGSEVRILLAAAPSFAGTAAVLVMLATHLSPSVIPGRAAITTIVIGYAIGLVVVQVTVALVALRGHPERRRAAASLGLVALAPAALLAGIAWAAFPPPYTAMPGPHWLVIVPAVELAAACCASAVALVLIIELVLPPRHR